MENPGRANGFINGSGMMNSFFRNLNPFRKKFPEMACMPYILLGCTFILILMATAYYHFRSRAVIIRHTAPGNAYLYVPTGATPLQLTDSLKRFMVSETEDDFLWLARRKGLFRRIIPGRYRLKEGMRNFELVGLLRSGSQEPLRMTVPLVRTPAEMAGRLARKLEPDSSSWMRAFSDPTMLLQFQISPEQLFTIIIPETYDFYWNTSPEKWLAKMKHESDLFWNGERSRKAGQRGLSVPEVIILASVVEKETNQNDEKPTIAGVYLNRLARRMPLQADPTVVFAWQDFSIRRVLKKHLEIASPYNTYLHQGLPPGPICLPSVASIDAVLDAASHQYLYFCAREDLSGYHNFAATLREHNRNAQRYQAALNKFNIR